MIFCLKIVEKNIKCCETFDLEDRVLNYYASEVEAY